MKDLELLIAMIRQVVDGAPTHRARRTETRAQERQRDAEWRRLGQQDRDAAAVMAWACPSLIEDRESGRDERVRK